MSNNYITQIDNKESYLAKYEWPIIVGYLLKGKAKIKSGRKLARIINKTNNEFIDFYFSANINELNNKDYTIYEMDEYLLNHIFVDKKVPIDIKNIEFNHTKLSDYFDCEDDTDIVSIYYLLCYLLKEKMHQVNANGFKVPSTTKINGNIACVLIKKYIESKNTNIVVSMPNSYILGCNVEWDLLILKPNTKLNQLNIYQSKDVITAVECKAIGLHTNNGIFEYLNDALDKLQPLNVHYLLFSLSESHNSIDKEISVLSSRKADYYYVYTNNTKNEICFKIKKSLDLSEYK